MRPAVLLFAKAPIPGRVKTRLAAGLGDHTAAELHHAFLLDMLETLGALAPDVDLELHADIRYDAWPQGVVTALQAPGDLGSRMLSAFNAALGQGRPQVCIVGSDAPSLPREYVAELLQSPADVALGPAEDGGYYAICCRRVHCGMFDGVEWSSPAALEQTESACRQCGLSTARGSRWFDVDEYADLLRLLRDHPLPRHTADWLKTRPEFYKLTRIN